MSCKLFLTSSTLSKLHLTVPFRSSVDGTSKKQKLSHSLENPIHAAPVTQRWTPRSAATVHRLIGGGAGSELDCVPGCPRPDCRPPIDTQVAASAYRSMCPGAPKTALVCPSVVQGYGGCHVDGVRWFECVNKRLITRYKIFSKRSVVIRC